MSVNMTPPHRKSVRYPPDTTLPKEKPHKSVSTDLLAMLPVEDRNRIYRYLFAGQEKLTVHHEVLSQTQHGRLDLISMSTNDPSVYTPLVPTPPKSSKFGFGRSRRYIHGLPLQIFLVNKTIKREASRIFYAITPFTINIGALTNTPPRELFKPLAHARSAGAGRPLSHYELRDDNYEGAAGEEKALVLGHAIHQSLFMFQGPPPISWATFLTLQPIAGRIPDELYQNVTKCDIVIDLPTFVDSECNDHQRKDEPAVMQHTVREVASLVKRFMTSRKNRLQDVRIHFRPNLNGGQAYLAALSAGMDRQSASRERFLEPFKQLKDIEKVQVFTHPCLG